MITLVVARTFILVCCSAALGGCASNRQELFTGPVVAESGICGPSASNTGVMQGSLSIRQNSVVFAPEQGVVTLPGKRDLSGHVVAGQTLAGADHKPFPMAFEGDVQGDKAVGVYATPRCRAKVEFRRLE